MLFKGGRDSRTLACPLSTKQENTWKSHITVASKLRHLLDLFTISSIKEEQVHATVVVFEVYLAVHPNDSIHGFPQASAVCHMSYCNRTAMHYVGRVEGRVEDDKSHVVLLPVASSPSTTYSHISGYSCSIKLARI